LFCGECCEGWGNDKMSGGDSMAAKKVLFVDDDAFYRDMGEGALLDAGFRVAVAETGSGALTRLETDAVGPESIDLIVLDLEMPGITGFDVIERIRAVHADRHVPIIVITGHEDTQSVERAFEAGATSFLAKPLNWSLFVHHVRFVLKAEDSNRAARDSSRVAESVSALKSRLISVLVNEFQTPLQSAYGFATLLKQETDGPIASQLYRSWISEVSTSLQRLRGTHVKMLNFGHILADGLKLNTEVFALDGLVDDVMDLSDEAIRRRELNAVVQHESAYRLKIDGDRTLMLQALKTIVDHAAQFSPRGQSIAITTGTDLDGHVVIAVHDRSPSLNGRQIADLLGLGGQSTSAIGGLSMARVILEAHQGHVRATPLLEGGMLIEIIVPKERVHQHALHAGPQTVRTVAA
jgi:two-component system, sensor histidine kinase and response regulator